MMQSNGIHEGKVYHRQRSSSTESMESPKPPLNPSGSTMSLGSRPPLVWLFNHIRQEGKTSLSKEDLQKLVGPQVDPHQLDSAFENLDADKDGVVSMDEFIAGFSRFWRETPDTPARKQYEFNFTSPAHMRKRPPSEERYEYLGEENIEEEAGPDEEFQRTLCVLSSHNRHSMEQLWRSLKEANPELLTDFEEFVTEVASEVEGAQRALDNQRKANKKEAMELDNEIESRLSAAQTTLHIQTSLVRQEEKAKLERRLVSKESELFSVRNQLQELESEITETQQNRQELEQQCQDLWKAKQALEEKLEESERRLEETQKNKQEKTMETLTIQQQEQNHQEAMLLQQKKKYEEEITKLREELEVYSKKGVDATEDEEVESLMQKGVARPDLLATTGYHRTGDHGGSLMAEIADKEGMASPLLRMEHVLQPSPFLRSARVGSVRRKKSQGSRLKTQRGLSSSLPNLADIDSLDMLEELPHPASTNRFSVLLPSDDTPPDFDPIDSQLEQPIPLPMAGEGLAQEDTTLHPLDGRDLMDLEDCKPLEFVESLSSQPDYIFKILVVGNSYVGKSSFLMRLCNNTFSQRYSSTIGVDFYSKALCIEDKIVSLQLWDTAGQERFQSVTKAYYRGAQGVLLMYDISQEESFIAVKSWINSINDNVEEQPAAMCLVGNKMDLDDEKEREVSTETGETFAKIYGAGFIETSAKTGYNVGKSLLMLVRSVKRYYEEEEEGGRSAKHPHSNITTKKIEEPKSEDSKCCR